MTRSKLFNLLAMLCACTASYGQTVIPGGYVSGIWGSGGSPYLVEGNIMIHEDSSLHIGEGVTVIFSDSVSFDVFGIISASGSAADPVYFTGSTNGWRGIRISDSPALADTSAFIHCLFDGARHPANEAGGALRIENRHEVRLSYCNFTGNEAGERGGALELLNADVLIEHSSFVQNQLWDTISAKGGAIYMINANPLIRNSLFSLNSALNGGAIYAVNSSPEITGCDFIENSSLAGGGGLVFHQSGQPLIRECVFSSNQAYGSGGAMAFLQGIQAQVNNCSFAGNLARSGTYLGDGGAVLITPYDNEAVFINCHFSENLAGDFGGAIYATSPTQIINCLFTANEAPAGKQEGGGGALCAAITGILIMNTTFSGNKGETGPCIFAQDAGIYMLNSIIWDDQGPIAGKIFLSTLYDPPVLSVDHCNIEGGQASVSGTGAYQLNWKNGNLSEDPHFLLPPADFSLAWNSGCIDAGRSDTLGLLIPAADLSGNPRIMGAAIDIGCYEYQDPIMADETAYALSTITLFPNPSTTYFCLKSTSENNIHGRLIMSDQAGKYVSDQNICLPSQGLYRHSVQGLKPGLYLLELYSENVRRAFRLIVL
jgi:predicted outer membrane repeat protein